MPRIQVLLTPHAAPVPRHSVAVIVDVLRASSTLSYALVNGATRVLPVATPDQARALAAHTPGALLCGERDGKRIEGFALGNSPAEYRPEIVRGRPLVFASTNGSIALLAAAGARRRLLGSFINAGAVVNAVANASQVA